MADGRQDNSRTGRAAGAATDRDARLRAALRANLARRKARAQALGDDPEASPHSPGRGAPQDPPEKD